MNFAQLDVERFQKVRTLIARGSTKGEKTAARARALAMADAAGLTFEAACLQADAETDDVPPAAPPSSGTSAADSFNAFFNTPEMRAERAAREVKRQARCRELLAEYGSEDAVFADTPREEALREALAPFIVWDARPDHKGHYEIRGWDEYSAKAKMPAEIREAITHAWPFPDTVVGVWAEYSAADKLDHDRDTMADGYYTPHRWVEARREIVEHLLDTMPAAGPADLLARLSWFEYLNGRGFTRDVREDTVLLATLRADVERLAISDSVTGLRSPVSGSAPVQRGQADQVDNLATRSASDRRRAVMSILDAPDTTSLTDREIARRVGVSPTTVGNLRRRVRQAGEGLGAAS